MWESVCWRVYVAGVVISFILIVRHAWRNANKPAVRCGTVGDIPLVAFLLMAFGWPFLVAFIVIGEGTVNNVKKILNRKGRGE